MVVLRHFRTWMVTNRAGTHMEEGLLPLWLQISVMGVTVSPPVAPDVSKAADLLHQSFAATNGGGGAARNVPDNTWEQIVTLLQQSVGKNQSMSNSRWDAAGMDHRPQLSPRLYTIKELYKPTHVDDKVGSTVTHVAKEKVPFCFRCKTKGHQSSDSNIELFC